MTCTIHFIFDQPPCPEGARFVECETPDGKSLSVGEWRERADGLWELVVEVVDAARLDAALTEARAALDREIKDKTRARKFSVEEIASAVSYRRGYIEGLTAFGKVGNV